MGIRGGVFARTLWRVASKDPRGSSPRIHTTGSPDRRATIRTRSAVTLPEDHGAWAQPDATLNSVATTRAYAHGPSAFGGGFRRFVELTVTIARTDFKLRFFGSALGYVWSLIRPLMFFGVLYLVFTKVFRMGQGIPHYAVYLLASIVCWNYFIEVTAGCVPSLVARESMLRKVRFPRMIIPLAVSLTALFNLGMNFVAVVVFAIANGVDPRLGWLEAIPIVFGWMVLATSVGMLLSAWYVRYRDVQPIWDVLSQVLFYGSPIIFIVAYFRRLGLSKIAMVSPIATLNTQLGHALIGNVHLAGQYAKKYGEFAFPSAASAAGGYVHLLPAAAIVVFVFFLGYRVFTREAPLVAEHL
jgi:ABC-2 type transport system permease protein